MSELDQQDRTTEMMEAYRNDDGMSLRRLGSEFGISHERVRQLLDARDPKFISGVLDKRAKRARAQLRKQERDEQRQRGHCRICGEPITRRGAKYTCNPEHQAIWNLIKTHIDPEVRQQRRLYMARSFLESGRPLSEAKRRSAQAVVDGTAPPLRDDQRFVPGSKTLEAYLWWYDTYGPGADGK